MKASTVIHWRARAYDVAAMEAIAEKRRLNRTNVMRIALAHFIEFEGLRSEVDEKARLLVSEPAV